MSYEQRTQSGKRAVDAEKIRDETCFPSTDAVLKHILILNYQHFARFFLDFGIIVLGKRKAEFKQFGREKTFQL